MSRKNQHLSDPGVRPRERTGAIPWRSVALVLAAATVIGFQPAPWIQTEDLAGTTVLAPGEQASLRIWSAMENDRGEDTWGVSLRIVGVSASGGSTDSSDHAVLHVSGQVEGDPASTCEEAWDPDTGTFASNYYCRVEAICPDGSSSCEAVVVFQLLSTSDASVTVDWVVRAAIQGSMGCNCASPDNVEASLELEVLD